MTLLVSNGIILRIMVLLLTLTPCQLPGMIKLKSLTTLKIFTTFTMLCSELCILTKSKLLTKLAQAILQMKLPCRLELTHAHLPTFRPLSVRMTSRVLLAGTQHLVTMVLRSLDTRSLSEMVKEFLNSRPLLLTAMRT
jgi:hypothetical protein